MIGVHKRYVSYSVMFWG